ncbi:hypothetical protein [Pseudaminobacter soli (ex Li et al. 2025)]|uniref:hypothetical protein n=1 Tax=Pseudaminobacter soli (ex Li et al. 2025) TaxID=1295366 RepID=UPI0011B26107|nr:hypothetical protein [Mesorhizobium soli]
MLVVDQHDEDHSDEFDDIVRAIHRADFATIWKGGVIASTPAAISEKLDYANRDPEYWTQERKRRLQKEREARLAAIRAEEATKP